MAARPLRPHGPTGGVAFGGRFPATHTVGLPGPLWGSAVGPPAPARSCAKALHLRNPPSAALPETRARQNRQGRAPVRPPGGS
eukprot:6532042-Alexandrium_andersonii.AAC.1